MNTLSSRRAVAALTLLPTFLAPCAWPAALVRAVPDGSSAATVRFAPPAAALAVSGAVSPALLADGLRSAASLPVSGAPAPLTAASAAPAAPATPAGALKQSVAELGPEAVTAPDYKPGLIRHIVLFRYKDSVTDEQKAEVKRRFLALHQLCARQSCPYIASIETGSQNSGEGVDQGLEQGFLVTFRSEGDRNYYVGQPIITDPRYYDPAHQAFKEFVGPLLREPVNPTGVLVFDYAVEAAVTDAARDVSARANSDARETARRLSESSRDGGNGDGSAVSGRSAAEGPAPLARPGIGMPPSEPVVPPVKPAAAPASASRRLLASLLPLLVWPAMLGVGGLLLAFPVAGGFVLAGGFAAMFAYLGWKTYKPANPSLALARLGLGLAALSAWAAGAAVLAALLHAAGFSPLLVGAATALVVGFGFVSHVAFRAELGAELGKVARGLALGLGQLIALAAGFIAVAFAEAGLAAAPRQDWVIQAGMLGAAALFVGYVFSLSRIFGASRGKP